jgi:hypothetical protein
MSRFSLFTILSFSIALMASLAQAATQVIVPLYAYPTDQEWTIMESTLAQYSNVEFLVIINPSNGPESSSLNSDWQTGIGKLKSYSNCQIIGYVLTNDGGRATSDVESDVNMYAAWPASYGVDGIFLDEVAVNDVSYYSTISSYIKSKISPGIVVLNPGTLGATEYFDFAQVVIFEDTYSSFSSQNVPGPPSGAAAASAIIINTMPDSESTFSSLIASFISAGYGSIYLTDDPATYQNLGSSWNTFCGLMSSAVGGSSTPAATTESDPPASSPSSSSTPVTTSTSHAPAQHEANTTPEDDTTPVVTTTTSSTPTTDPTNPDSSPTAHPETVNDDTADDDDDDDDDGDDDDVTPTPGSSWTPHSRPHHHYHGWGHKHRQWA